MLKEQGYVQNGEELARPDWDRFARDAAGRIAFDEGSRIAEALQYLNTCPPQVQTAALGWETREIPGNTAVERAFQVARRVRNNLFHGGKHTPESEPGRDEKLVRCVLLIMYEFLVQNGDWRSTYEETEA